MLRLNSVVNKLQGMIDSSSPITASHFSNRRWRWLKIIWLAFIGAVFLLLAYTIYQNRVILREMWRLANYWYFAAAIFAYLLGIGAVIVGWHLIMCQIARQCSRWLNIKIYLSTLAARRLPGTLWYIAGRSIYYKRLGVPHRVSGLAAAIEVVVSVVSGLMIGAPALFGIIGVNLLTLAVFAAIEVAGLIVLTPRVLHRLMARMGYNHELNLHNLTEMKILSWLSAYTLMWLLGGLMLWCLTMAIFPRVSDELLNIISIWSLSGAGAFVTFLLPSSLGFTEIALTFLLSTIMPIPVAITVALVARVMTTTIDVLSSSLCLITSKKLDLTS